MKVGWMWFDNDPARSIEEKIQQAAQHYHTKFGRFPNTCYVNQRSINGDLPDGLPAQGQAGAGGFHCGKVKVVAAANILPHHFWLGVSDTPATPPR